MTSTVPDPAEEPAQPPHHFSSGTGSPVESLREQIATALHLGQLVPGDRLPSIREIAETFGISPYEAVRTYRALEAEGYVETRSRSGIYVAPHHEPKRAPTSEAAGWLVEVLVEACRHQVRIPALPDFVTAHTAASRLRCVCIAGDRDTLHALCREMDRQFGFTPHALSTADLPAYAPGETIDPALVHDDLRGADLLVTTAFHAPATRRLADALGTRMAVVTLNPEHAAAVEEHARQRPIKVVCVDPAFGERMRSLRGGRYRDRIEVVAEEDADSLASIDRAESVFLTRAAHDRLGARGFRLLTPFSPFLSPRSTRALVETLVDLNLRER